MSEYFGRSHHHNSQYGFHHTMCSCPGAGRRLGVRRGEFRFLILIALSEKPMHGYALIKEIGSTYALPTSAGLVYPVLQELEYTGLVTSENKDGRKVYSITSKGSDFLVANPEIVERLKAGREFAGRLSEFEFTKDLHDLNVMIIENVEYMDTEKMQKINEIMKEAKRKMATVIYE